LKKPLAVLWLVFTLLPLGYIAYFVMYTLSMSEIDGPASFQQREQEFDFLFKAHMSAIGLIWILIASYVIYLFRTSHVPRDKKALWAVVLFMVSPVAMPAFWFLYVWKPLSAIPTEPVTPA
jgi:hypothetical protein